METRSTYLRNVDNIEPLIRVDFCIQSNDLILNDSAISEPNGITIAEIYNNNEPVEGGVIDRRLGVTDRSICRTCGEPSLTCPGHQGHIELVEPVLAIQYITYIKSICSFFCIRCSKLLVRKNEEAIINLVKKKNAKQRFSDFKILCKKVTVCENCGLPAHKITIEKKGGGIVLVADPKMKTSDNENDTSNSRRTPKIITARLYYNICKAISNIESLAVGIDTTKSRPEDMVSTRFPVAPNPIRPSVRTEIATSYTMVDSLSNKLLSIVKSNENLRDAKGDGSLNSDQVVDEGFTLLQYHCATFYANDILGLPKSLQKNKTEVKTIAQRMKGKEGRIRGNLMGKRVDMSARTVISSDPNVPLDGVGVPLYIAKNLTYPEIVNPKNRAYLTELVKNGQKRIYPGANYITKTIINEDGEEVVKKIDIRYIKKEIELNDGDTVDRHLGANDIVLFNRQPSLHKLSMMGHRSSVIPDPSIQTFRINVSVTEPYNADFDGDETNIHAPQSIQTAIELRLIASAAKRFMSPTTTRVAIVAKQDTVMGSYLASMPGIYVDWKDCMNILMKTSFGISNTIPKNMLVSTKYLLSQIIPDILNMVRMKDGKYDIKIEHGMLTDGILSKSNISQILQKIWFMKGSNMTRNFIDDLQRLILRFLMSYGYTVSIKDMIVSENIKESVKRIIETKRKESMAAITEYENDPYIMTPESFEASQRENLKGPIQEEIQKLIMNNFKTSNGLYICIASGSNGTDMNAGQIIGCIGQIIVEGKRIQKKFNNRTLPTFAQYDESPFARGFCYNSFMAGLGPMEFFFHVMAGREGLISTAIKTADTGYVQRKLIKFMEDIKVEYDGTVRNANDKIIQFVYGDNNINVEKQSEQKLHSIGLSNQEIKDKYLYSDQEIKELDKSGSKYTKKLNDQYYNKLIAMRDAMRQSQIKTNVSSVEFKENYMMPVDINQTIINITSRKNRNNKKLVDPYYVLIKIKEMYTGKISKTLKFNENSSIKKDDDVKIKLLLKYYLYDYLCPRKCTNQYNFSKEEFDEIVEYFNKIMLLAKVDGGEMVGFVGAQSIGEPVTQSNLKEFHKSGVGKSVTGGLARVKEILSVSKKIKTPITRIILEDKYKNDKVVATRIASYLNYTTLQNVAETAEIYYDPKPFAKNSIMNRDKVDQIFDGGRGKSGCQTDIEYLPWLLRIVLSKERMIDRGITMLDIKTSFCNNWANRNEDSRNKKDYKKIIDKITQCAIVTNFDNSPSPTVHIRFDANNYNQQTLQKFQDIIIEKYRIKGIEGITDSTVDESKYIVFGPDGKVETKKEWVITTSGINFDEMMRINGIDLQNTRCNDINIVHAMYGVEAARASYIREFTLAVESSNGNTSYQHVALLADAVTHLGSLIPVNRHGTNKLDTDPFSRASFEKTGEQLLAAAVFGETDHIRSVSARIMTCATVRGGTGAYDLLIDHEKIKRVLKQKENKEETTIIKKKTAISDLIRKKRMKD